MKNCSNTYLTSDTEAQVHNMVNNKLYKTFMSSMEFLQKQEKAMYVLLTPTGLMFPRVIDLIHIYQ
jgi:hypothetical protein